MKTDDLVSLLASGVASVDPHATQKRWMNALFVGVLGAALLMLVALGPRVDLSLAMSTPVFWLKLAFPAGVSLAALWVAARLARPGQRIQGAWLALLLPVLVVWVIAVWELVNAPAGERMPLLLGSTWTTCPLLIAMVSLPVFAAVLWAIKGLAPTRLVWAGAGAGLLAGALGAFVYAFHCPEMQPLFLGVWYLLGMLIPTAVGAVLGPRVLRW